jgi:LEA14-like dessication related protein
VLIGPRRAVLIGVIAAVALTIILLPLIWTINAPDFNKIVVRFSNVTVTGPNAQNMQIKAVFSIMNPTDVTVTTSKVDYELFANGVSLGTHTLSYEDVPLNGRPAIFSQSTVPISDTFTLNYQDKLADIYTKIKDNPSEIKWRASGTAEIDSTLTIASRDFNNEL